MATYTPETTAAIIEMYQAGGNDALPDIAKKFGVTVPSVRSKLVAEKVYVRSAPSTAGSKKARTSKAEYASAIGTVLNLAPGVADSLEKASLATLQAVMQKLIELGDKPAS